MNLDKDIIVYLGLAGAGKTYQSNLLLTPKIQFTKVSFAQELREMVLDLLGIEDFDNYSRFKREVIINYNEKSLTGRDLLQRLGTNVIRKRLPSYFEEIVKQKMLAGNRIVLDDARFLTEITLINNFAQKNNYAVSYYLCDREEFIYPEIASLHESEQLAANLSLLYGKDTLFWKNENIDKVKVKLTYEQIVAGAVVQP